MGSLKDEATAYEPKKTKNIADLESFDLSEPTELKEGEDNEGKKFAYYVLVRDGEEYRIPNGVMETVKNLIAANAKHGKELKTLAVEKTGEGMKSKYSVITIE